MISSKFLTLTTNEDGASFVAFPDAPAHTLNVINATGVDLTFQHIGDEDEGEFILPSGMGFAFRGITNANQLRVKRSDENTTTVTLNAVEAER